MAVRGPSQDPQPLHPLLPALAALTVSSSSRHCWEFGLGYGRPRQLRVLEMVCICGCLVLMLPTLP